MNHNDMLDLMGTLTFIASVCLYCTGHWIGASALLAWLIGLMYLSDGGISE